MRSDNFVKLKCETIMIIIIMMIIIIIIINICVKRHKVVNLEAHSLDINDVRAIICDVTYCA